MVGDARFLTRLPLAHRGLHDGNQTRIENSMSAFEAAIEKGYGIELDVQPSSDGVAMVFHDAKLDRLTSEKGMVRDRTASDLQSIRLADTGDTIPRLSDVLALIAGRVPLVIEMKANGPFNTILADAVARDLANYDGEAAVMSFDHGLLAAFNATGAPRPLGLTAERVGEPFETAHRAAYAHGISFASFNVKEVPNAFVDDMRTKRGLPVITWTVRTPDDVAATRAHADQMTFEGFFPDLA